MNELLSKLYNQSTTIPRKKKKKQYLYISSTTLPLHVYISIRIYRKTIIVEFNTSLESFDAPPR